MRADVTSLSSFQKQIQVTVPAAHVRAQMDAAFKNLERKARIPGFRPGHAPRRVLEARYLPQVRADVAQDLINDGYKSALSTHGLQPVSQPKLQQAAEIDGNSDFTFTIAVDVRPDVTLTQITGLDVYYPPSEVSVSEVDAAVNRKLQGAARLAEVTDRAAVDSDLAVVELTVKAGKEVVSQEAGTTIRLAGDPYYTGIEALLIGAKVGQTKKGEVAFGAEARTEAVAGKSLQVVAKVLGLQAQVVPTLSDDVATELGYEGGAAGMRLALQAQLAQGRADGARNQARANLLEALIAANPFDVPPTMVEQSFGMLVEQLKLQQSWLTGKPANTITFGKAQIDDLRVRAVFAAKAAILIDRVIKTESITVNDGDVERKIEALAVERSQTVEAVRGWLKREGAMDDLRQNLGEELALDWLLERANLVDAPVRRGVAAVPEKKADAPAKAKASKKAAAAAEPATEPAAEAAPTKKAAPTKAAASAEDAPKKAAAKKAPAAKEAAEPKAKAKKGS